MLRLLGKRVAVPKAEMHWLDWGRLAVEDCLDYIAATSVASNLNIKVTYEKRPTFLEEPATFKREIGIA